MSEALRLSEIKCMNDEYKYEDELRDVKIKRMVEELKLRDETIKRLEAEKEAKDKQVINERISRLILNAKSFGKSSTFYIATSNLNQKKNIYKLGHIKGTGDKLLRKRISQYNTGSTDNTTRMYIVYKIETYDASTLDHLMKKLTIGFKDKNNSESVILHWDILMILFENAHNNYCNIYECHNKLISDGSYKTSITTKPNIQHSIIKTPVIINVVNLSEEDKLNILIKSIDIWCINNNICYEFEKDRDDESKNIILDWDSIKTVIKDVYDISNNRLKPSRWRNVLKIIGNNKSIKKIKWKK